MSTLKEQIEALKQQRIEEIINDDSISKLEKLKLFSDENLFEIEDYIQDDEIFKEWIEELVSMVKSENGSEGRRVLVDTFLSPSVHDIEKHTVLDLHDISWTIS